MWNIFITYIRVFGGVIPERIVVAPTWNSNKDLLLIEAIRGNVNPFAYEPKLNSVFYSKVISALNKLLQNRKTNTTLKHCFPVKNKILNTDAKRD